jgi:predicted ester cyclase
MGFKSSGGLALAAALAAASWSAGALAQVQPPPAACPPVSGDALAARNEALVRAFWSAFERSDWDALDALTTADYAHNNPSGRHSLADFKKGGAWVHSGFYDYRFQIDDMVVTPEKVVVRWTATGRHVGSYFGEQPTGKVIATHGMHIHTVLGCRLAADWEVIDTGALARQLGLRSTPINPQPASATH